MTREARLLVLLKEADEIFVVIASGEEASDAALDSLAHDITTWREKLEEEIWRS